MPERQPTPSGSTAWDDEFKRRLLDRAGDMARDGHGEPWPHSWVRARLARRIWWLAEVGRTGEAHALLVNAGYPVRVPRSGPRPNEDLIERT